MSNDGSFSLQSSLDRFLSRNSNLIRVPKFAALSEKGAALTTEEFAESISDLFIHPSYTISIIGCFRAIGKGIVVKVVRKLQKFENLLGKDERTEADEEVAENEVNVIDFYLRRKRGLRVHELACLAFVRTLNLLPSLLSCILTYFKFAPPPFKSLQSIHDTSELVENKAVHILQVVRVSYHFLLMDYNKVFTEHWDWSCFLELLKHMNECQLRNDATLDVIWSTVQILSLRISYRSADNYIGEDQALACFQRWIAYCQDTSLEYFSYYYQDSEFEAKSCAGEGVDFSQCIESCENDYASNDELEPNRKKNRNDMSSYMELSRYPFVLTTTLGKSFEMTQMAVSQKWPVLLHGPTGSGKTALVQHLAEITKNQILFIHMDDQMDNKTLIGSYVSTERPGEFKWQHGSLTQAILNGYWVVFEDIDKAPNEVQSLLLPLLEGSSSFITGHGEVLRVAESFRLFGTISTSKHQSNIGVEGRYFFSPLWWKVTVGTPSTADMQKIVNTWYPSLAPISARLLETFQMFYFVTTIRYDANHERGMLLSGNFNRISIRDLLKWCKRIAGVDLISGTGISSIACQKIYTEAVDIFTGYLASLNNRLSAIKEIDRIWGRISIPENLYHLNRPIIQATKSYLQVGRVTIDCLSEPGTTKFFINLRSSLHVLERIACSVKFNEPVLLVGETGTGKTTLVQNLAERLGRSLTVMNLSQQSDATDLLGGYRPTDAFSICLPIYKEFRNLFVKSVSKTVNEAKLRKCEEYIMGKKWAKLLKFCKTLAALFLNIPISSPKRKKPLDEDILSLWKAFYAKLEIVQKQIKSSSGMSFKFVEGAFITALRNGNWILLDEVNLAPPETLQRIISVLDGESGTICLAERGDITYVKRNPQFRLFACMNPATDAGKRELPLSFRSRLTEYFVDDVLDDEDLRLFVNQYLPMEYHHLPKEYDKAEIPIKIVEFYKEAKKKSEDKLQDGANQKPQFSLRSLARALQYLNKAERKYGFVRAIYDGFSMFFLTLLDEQSAKIMEDMIKHYLIRGTDPSNITLLDYVSQVDSSVDSFMSNYVITKSVEQHLTNLARAVYIKKYPVLLQGPTSSGKTSLVRYLATSTGHKFVRINNHEHTDLQEYLGSYVTDSQGKLIFEEGILVKAVRNGYWIVLDELNLAPSDVLEALNRLLDDNREIFVPETQESVSAHPEFMLFATQNPPMLYGGRKVLSRAFRNRFLEIHVDEIPDNELSEILVKRCVIPKSRADNMVKVMKDLQLHRQNSKAFAGKHGFITPRDLFRWALRYRKFEDLAKEGYLLLAERLRDEYEKSVVQKTLERRLRVTLAVDDLYNDGKSETEPASIQNIVWTKSMKRLYYLVKRCYEMREPVLLIGETGGGKTTVCQLLSEAMGRKLHILNCHQYTETSDFIGGFHPVRDRSRLFLEFKSHIEELKQSKVFLCVSQDYTLSTDIAEASSTINQLNEFEKIAASHPCLNKHDIDAFVLLKKKTVLLFHDWQRVFLWQNGPLVQAMKSGDFFLIDEISLADDSVLERLNSVLEPERKLSLAEKGGSVLEEITAHKDFFVLATMNPGGDYGKKELSPALRNRFTEIWVSSVTDFDDLRHICLQRFKKPELTLFAEYIIIFWQWFNQLQTGRMLTIRDLLSWVSFMNETEESLGPVHAFIHGAFLVILDGLSLGTGLSKIEAKTIRENALNFIHKELMNFSSASIDSRLLKLENYGWGDTVEFADNLSDKNDERFGINPFYIRKNVDNLCKSKGFEFLAPTTQKNTLRVLRGLQLSKPVLLEGSPGVGKTSLVVALAEYSGHEVVRINLSEQTDMMDLLGSDLPVEGDNGMEFSWSDGILLQALKKGNWVLLDELNLAPQSVLEGLNAILDHRAEVYIPELCKKFKCPPSFRVFACQNPSSQGGGRKGLPKSFLNRFTKVYVDELSEEDYNFICQSRFPSLSPELISNLICFNNRLFEDTMVTRKYGQDGSPWEFNLRDVIRSCQIMEGAPEASKANSFLNIVYLQRMRAAADRKEVVKLYEEVFGSKPLINVHPNLDVSSQKLIIGTASVDRNHLPPQWISKNQLHILPGFHHSLEAIAACVQHQWLCILVGPYSSGKTSLIRVLSGLTGNSLVELNLSSGTDVSELLGCFEQYNSHRIFRDLLCQVERYIKEYFAKLSTEDLRSNRMSLFAKWLASLAAGNHSINMSTSRNLIDGLLASIGDLIEIMKLLIAHVEKYENSSLSWTCSDVTKTLETALDLEKKLKTEQTCKTEQTSKFKWMTGDLIKAIECGNWVVLDNANLCNPTVLDRINSLVEQDGFITVNECGLVDGKPVRLVPHPNFRMFLTMDPKHGEISRAMRNRGVEIFMMQPDWLVAEESPDSENIEINDVRKFLLLSDIPLKKLILAMTEAHMHARNMGSSLGVHITLLELSRWVKLFRQLIFNGNQPKWSLQSSYEYTYLSSLGENEGRDIVEKAKFSCLSCTGWYTSNDMLEYSLSLPGGWPSSHSVRDFIFYPKETHIRQNCAYLEHLGYQFGAYKLSSFQNGAKFRAMKPSLLPKNLVLSHLFPKVTHNEKLPEFDEDLVNQMLYFASNWTLEQATEADYSLYLQYFNWCDVEMFPHCDFFKSLLQILDKERNHPIWIHSLELSADLKPLQMVRLTYHQWNTEDSKHVNKCTEFWEVLNLLRGLEEKVLEIFSDSHKFIHVYSSLLENHILFWKSYTTFKFDQSSIILHWLMKEATRLKSMFPKEIENLTKKILKCDFYYHTPKLWVHAGHPFLPSSAEIYDKMLQLLNFCEETWINRNNQILSGNAADLKVVLSANTELRQLAVQAVCMLWCTIMNCDQDTSNSSFQLEDIYQGLRLRVEHEKENLKMTSISREYSNYKCCCTFPSDILCMKSGFDNWMESLPLLDQRSFLMDITLLNELSICVLTDSKEIYQALLSRSDFIQDNLDFSICYSTRPPMDFAPHQAILWLLNAWTSVDSVNTKLACLLNEFWFSWHTSLWNSSSKIVEELSLSAGGGSCHLIHLTSTAILDKIIEGAVQIKDCEVHLVKLRTVSRILWKDIPLKKNLVDTLLSAASNLLKQIILVHQKYFDEDTFQMIKVALSQLAENDASTCYLAEVILNIKSLLSKSRHRILRSVLVPVIDTIFEELYNKNHPSDSFNLASAWVHIGALRFSLLLNPNGPDPAMKYSFKHFVISEKISSVELEAKVRKECAQLAGRSSTRDNAQERVSLLQNLEKEQRRVQSKIVFRPQSSKYKTMCKECSEFDHLVSNCMKFVEELKSSASTQSSMDKANSWQITASSFVDKLSKDYAEYKDLIQPVQVAIYEMKLGLSLAVSCAKEEIYLKKVDEENCERITVPIYNLMRFPRELTHEFTPDYINSLPVSCISHASMISQVIDANFLKKLAAVSSEAGFDKVTQAKIHHIILVGAMHYACNSLLMDKTVFMLLDEIFGHFVTLWMEMKSQAKVKEDGELEYFKFKPRSLVLEDIVDANYISDADENSAFGSDELLMEHEFTSMKHPAKEDNDMEEEWSMIPEYVLKSLVHIHGLLFGSDKLVEQTPPNFKLTEDRLSSFMDSYALGAKIIQDLQALSTAALDENLKLEQLFHVCLEYDRIAAPPTSRLTQAYNVYKDSNALVISKMVKPLTVVQEKVESLLVELPEHPALEKVIETTKTLLEFPLSTPVSKALLGLQLLVSRVQSLKENFSISLIDLVRPIYSLVSSWQKLELDSWPVLLDEVQQQYTSNAEKLWFPFRAILHRNLSGDGEMDTIQSMEDFIQTSSVGEFMRRLQLLRAFHGQLNHGIYLHAYSSGSLHMKENLSILYNVVGYYFQFVPLIVEHIESSRKEVEKELKECLKLYNWERSTVESFRRTRQKIWKYVKKYNEVLQQPVMIILNQDRVQRSETLPSWLEKKISDENNMGVVQFPLDIEQLNSAKRFLWFEEWKVKAESTLKSPVLKESIPENCMTAWKESWNSFEKISAHAAEFAHLWQHEKNNHKKKRVFRGLLKTLEQCGLSKSKTMFSELENKGSCSSSLFLQPSYSVENMLQSSKCILSWEAADKIYFKNLGMVQQLRQVRLNFNKTLILDQVEQAVSFIDHLMIVQQEQRYAAYCVSEQLQNLRCQFRNIRGREMGDNCILSPNQYTVIKFLWQQKNLFDNLLAMSKDTQLFLQKVENCHKNSCVVKAEVDVVSVILEKYIPVFLQSKEYLDKYLIDSNNTVTMSVKCMPLVASQQMEQLLALNFQVIQNFGEDINTLRLQKECRSAVRESVLDRLENLVIKGKTIFAKFNSEIEESLKSYSEEQNPTAAIEEINTVLTSVFKRMDTIWDDHIVLSESSAQQITALKELFEFHMKNMSLDHLNNTLKKAILSVSNLNNCIMTQINLHLGSLHSSLDLLLQFAENLLSEFLDAHKTIAEITHVLAHMFILLLSKGFGDTEEADDECDGSKDASGTGMGEGEGTKDVSEQIEDEEQLLGTSDKRDEKDKSEKIPNDEDKGIEMEEDFEGDTFSVSEDSGDNEKEEEEEDVNIESKMGETGNDKEVVDEKLWDKNKDDEPEKSDAEKYESGPSIKETETGDEELRAKEDDAPSLDESGEAENDKDGNEDDKIIPEEDNELNDMKLDKKNAFEDPTGIELSDHEKDFEDDAMEEAQEEFQEVNGDDVDEEMNDDGDGIDEEMKGDENNTQGDDDDDNNDNIDTGEGKDSTAMEVESKKENILPEKVKPSDNLTPNSESMEPANNSYSADKAEPEMRWSNSSDMNNNLAPSINSQFENAPKMEMSVPNSSDNSKLSSDNQPKAQNQENDSPSVSNFKSNPYRDIGNAMEEWKERVKVSDKLEENQPDSLLDETIDGNTDEHQYVSEKEKSTSQALGSATSDQVNDKLESKQDTETDVGDEVRKKEDVDIMDIIKENSETKHLMSNHNVPIKENANDKILNTVLDDDEIMEERELDRSENGFGDAVTFKNWYMNERDIMPMDDDILDDDSNFMKNVEVEELSDDVKQKAMTDWKRFELSTAKISQELAEHLRLVMEPTLASKLQGDYRTGKRINMKKVIPFIASHYRKDKIWLRRTKPNKRDYQVVVAIDDSRSMSENNCGTAAVESLVTVCRAMSQLEVGQFAVASFGQKGNIKLLHEFDQPFTGEAGVKMLSSLSFKQENTIADEPVVELLKHLNIMLDNAVMKARLPSGDNPLNQLILIIADGRFHEKENLKRCIRNALNRKRMIAFILLDSGDESIMDLQSASYEGNKLSLTKYLDSFPFPYYIILKNMEALPRALGDLLRQWFELMQNSSE